MQNQIENITSSINESYLGIIFITAVFLVGILLIISLLKIMRKRNIIPHSLNMVTLLISVPREVKQVTEEAKKEEKEMISIAETMFANIYSIETASNGLMSGLYGKEYVSFEIVAINGEIRFYVSTPKRLQDYIEKTIHSQYPKAYISEEGEYNVFKPKSQVRGVMLVTEKQNYLPFKTYQTIETDPLNAITNALSKLDEKTEGAAIQYLIRPAGKKWMKKGPHIAREMQRGKTYEYASASLLGKLFKRKEEGKSSVLEQAVLPGASEQQMSGGAPMLSPMIQEQIKALEVKSSKLGFETNIRIISSSDLDTKAEANLRNIVGAFTEYTDPNLNKFVEKKLNVQKLIQAFIFRTFDEKRKSILNTEELASVFHLPTKFAETPNIHWLLARDAPAPHNVPKEGLLLGKNTFRGIETPIRIKDDDRRRHMYIIGQTGVGKSNFLQNMIVQDIKDGKGLCVVDPHGDLVESVLPFIPKERVDDIILFEPFDVNRPMGLNMLEFKTEDQKDFAVQEMMQIFYKLFPPEMIGPMFEHQMRNVMLTLMADKENPGTLAEIPRMFTDNEYAKEWIEKLKDPVVKAFWEKEMAKTSDFHKSEMLGYLISKVGRFVENEMMRNIIGQSHSSFDLRKIMDEGKVLLVNLSKGKIGETNSSLLGLIIVSKIQMAAYSRADIPESERKDFYLYVDEFQNFATDSFASILSEARKYRLNLIVAHQYVKQLEEKIRDAVFGNVGTFTAFRVGVEDAEIVAKELEPVFTENDVINVEKFHAYLRLMIDSAKSKAFTMATYPPAEGANEKIANAVRELSRLQYGRSKSLVEGEIMERAQIGIAEKKALEVAGGEKTL
ncbi:MAG: type IV secretion system DNA-binding domain-containing protein [Patescibacteria group bacterium]|nr:type IV secretion system DNA-binding domain-containing protein [Patescibacteria group bacterium]